jgi:hypothetical protein
MFGEFVKLFVAPALAARDLLAPSAVTPKEAPAAKAAVDTTLAGPFHTRKQAEDAAALLQRAGGRTEVYAIELG